MSSWEAVAEILTMMNIDNFEPILLVSGVCPTLTPEDITLFVEKMENAQSGLTIRPNDYPVESTFCITDNGYVRRHAMSAQITARQQAKSYIDPMVTYIGVWRGTSKIERFSGFRYSWR